MAFSILARLPVVQVRLQLTALHLLLTFRSVGAHHKQFVQQVPDQQAGWAALVQLQPLAVHWAEVLLFQKVTQTIGAIGVTARGVHGSDEGLQADVAHQFIVHVLLVFVQMAFKAFVLLATLLTDTCPRQAPRAAGFGLCCSHRPVEFTLNFCVWKKVPHSPAGCWCLSLVSQTPEVGSYFIVDFF